MLMMIFEYLSERKEENVQHFKRLKSRQENHRLLEHKNRALGTVFAALPALLVKGPVIENGA